MYTNMISTLQWPLWVLFHYIAVGALQIRTEHYTKFQLDAWPHPSASYSNKVSVNMRPILIS